MIGEDSVGHHATHLHRRKGIEDEHHDPAFAADPVRHINRRLCSHGIAVGGDIGDQQRIGTGVHPDDRNAGIRRTLKPRSHLRGIDVDHDRIDLLRHRILDPRDDGGDVARRVDHVDCPARFGCLCLKPLHIGLRARLGEIRGDDRHRLG